MTATRVSWGRAFWAVVGATILAAVATLLALLPVLLIGVPVPFQDDTSGHGWPWRIDGPWSLAADVGPLLLACGLFAWFAESFTTGHSRVPTRRWPIALTAAALGWVSIHGSENAGLLRPGGLAAFLAILVVTREMSVRARPPWRWTPLKACLAPALVVVLGAVSLSYGLFHPLEAGSADAGASRNGRTEVMIHVRNGGSADAQVLAVTSPLTGARARISPSDSYEYSPDDPYVGTVPIAGQTIAGGESEAVHLFVRCSSARTLDRVTVRMRVLGRTVDQVVRIPPVRLGCD